MNKEEAERRAQEALDFYGSGKYKGYEEITMPDGSPGVRVTGFVPTLTNRAIAQQKWERDRRFRAVAERLYKGLEAIRAEGLNQNWSNVHIGRREQEYIAQFTYDFAKYVIDLVPHLAQADLRTAEEVVNHIPDMTTWPEQSE